MEQQNLLSDFATDTLHGLSAIPKFLSSKYFYDDIGSAIFQDIMQMPEYYLTDCEVEIFEKYKQEMVSVIGKSKSKLELIELGAGDGLKTKVLLSQLLEQNIDFKYIPIDISANAVENLHQDLKRNLPELKVEGRIGDYFKLIAELNGSARKVILFLGSNIGNFNPSQSRQFLKQLYNVLNHGDQLLIGFDLKKDSEKILKAYNDPHGHTASFNLNLLNRINNELDADFQLDNFFHTEVYDHETGVAKSYLISKKAQNVHIRKLNKSFLLAPNEKIFMEMSQKYDQQMINSLAVNAGFEVVQNYYDHKSWFVNSLWNVKDS
ncbi:MAG: L-histidine N(alpha)-methyltransferase [Lentimicrobium sp.]|nr:L-histidine N(alpha)-methyltransferase [Lentimicrobium sp.]